MNNRILIAAAGTLGLLAIGQFAISQTPRAPAPAAPSGPGAAPAPTGSPGVTAEGGAQVGYIFRYTPGVSKLLMDSMTFSQQQPLSLGECQATEKINGPIGCVTNCQQQPICLLVFQGPAGLQATDVMEKVKEEPVTAASAGPSPGASGAPSAPGVTSRAESFRVQAYLGH